MTNPVAVRSTKAINKSRCEQCGRTGTREFRTLIDAEHGIRIVVCANKAACRRRWPQQLVDDE